ncbi:unnamed protein product [Arabidopsis halleri]
MGSVTRDGRFGYLRGNGLGYLRWPVRVPRGDGLGYLRRPVRVPRGDGLGYLRRPVRVPLR